MRVIFLFSILVFASGCSTTRLKTVETKENHYPELGQVAEETLGNALYYHSYEVGYAAIRLHEEITSKKGMVTWTVPTQIAPLVQAKKDKTFFEGEATACSWLMCNTGPVRIEIPKDRKAYFRIKGVTKIESADEIPDYSDDIMTVEGRDSFRTEFIYNGISGTTVKFIYREFINDLSRPSFTQDVQYDLDLSKTIGFKGMEMLIQEASNDKIIYVITSPIERPNAR